MKKRVLALLTTAILLTLAACGGTAPAPSAPASQAPAEAVPEKPAEEQPLAPAEEPAEPESEAAPEAEPETAPGVDPELKAFLDSYEEFMDSYVELLEEYAADPTNLELLIEYTSFVREYEEFAEKADAYDAEDMSPADEAYYTETLLRIEKKLLDATAGLAAG